MAVEFFDEHREKIATAMDKLEQLGEEWADHANVDEIANRIANDPAAIRGLMIQSYIEGVYYGRKSTY